MPLTDKLFFLPESVNQLVQSSPNSVVDRPSAPPLHVTGRLPRLCFSILIEIKIWLILSRGSEKSSRSFCLSVTSNTAGSFRAQSSNDGMLDSLSRCRRQGQKSEGQTVRITRRRSEAVRRELEFVKKFSYLGIIPNSIGRTLPTENVEKEDGCAQASSRVPRQLKEPVRVRALKRVAAH